MKLKFHGGANEVGRSSIIINDELLLDYGIKPTEPPTYPIGDVRPKTIIISHGHYDHCGVIPSLMDLDAEIYSTPMTKKLTVLLAKDTLKIAEEKCQITPFYSNEIKVFEQRALTKKYNQSFKSNGYEICFYDAGHIPGSSIIHVKKDNDTLIYSGDFNTSNTELQNAAKLDIPQAKTLIIESTYFGRNHTSRRNTEKRFIQSIKKTLQSGGHAIIPAFGIGRTQEILLVLKKNNLFAHIDGMGIDVSKMIQRDPTSIANANFFNKAFTKENIIKLNNRENILKEPSIIVTTAGMLNGGPILYYIDKIANDYNSKLLLTGYQVEGTNGWYAINRRTIKIEDRIINLNCHIERYNFSAHADDQQLKESVKTFCNNGTEIVLPVHGDHTKDFAEWIRNLGVKSYAPKNEDTILIQ